MKTSNFNGLDLCFLCGKFRKAKYKEHKCTLVFKNVSLDYSWKEMSPVVFLYERKVAKAVVAGPVLTKKVRAKTITDTSQGQETEFEQKPESPVLFEQTPSGTVCKLFLRENKDFSKAKVSGWKSFTFKISREDLPPEQLDDLLTKKWILIRIKPGSETSEDSEPQVKIFSGNTRKETVKNYFHHLAKEFCSWLNETKNVDFVFKALKIKY